MSDTEKVRLIGKMIADLWEYHEADRITAGAEVVLTAINSVVEFGTAERT